MTINLPAWIATIGCCGVALIVFLESGVFFGFFLPGDSLLFATGLLASQQVLNIFAVIPSVLVAAWLGYQFGYWFGQHLGQWLIKRPPSWWFERHYLEQAQAFYERYGGRALVLGRLLPVIRTFVPIVAGMVKMPLSRYFLFNIIGGCIWGGGITLIGFGVGQSMPHAEKYLLPLTGMIIAVSVSPLLWGWIKKRLKKHRQK